MTTDRAPVYLRVAGRTVPAAAHVTEQYANNRDRSRSRPAEGPAAADARTETPPLGRTIAAGHAFVQNLRRGHYEIATEQPPRDRVRAAFEQLAFCI